MIEPKFECKFYMLEQEKMFIQMALYVIRSILKFHRQEFGIQSA